MKKLFPIIIGISNIILSQEKSKSPNVIKATKEEQLKWVKQSLKSQKKHKKEKR